MRLKSLGPVVITLTAIMLIGAIFLPDVRAVPTSQPVVVIPEPYSGILIVNTSEGQGSCFVVARQNGWYYAITAAHVVESIFEEDEFQVAVDNEGYDAEILRVNSDEDVALIRFQSYEAYKIYSFAKTTVEAPCTAIGYSRGSKLVYKGYIVSLDMEGFIVANGGVVPGCSGGVLLDSQNRAVGVTVQVATYYGWAFDSTAFYVPIRYAKALLVAMGIESS